MTSSIRRSLTGGRISKNGRREARGSTPEPPGLLDMPGSKVKDPEAPVNVLEWTVIIHRFKPANLKAFTAHLAGIDPLIRLECSEHEFLTTAPHIGKDGSCIFEQTFFFNAPSEEDECVRLELTSREFLENSFASVSIPLTRSFSLGVFPMCDDDGYPIGGLHISTFDGSQPTRQPDGTASSPASSYNDKGLKLFYKSSPPKGPQPPPPRDGMSGCFPMTPIGTRNRSRTASGEGTQGGGFGCFPTSAFCV
mmetsp:Transcript_97894/g.280004  ORF Transcript_97894/g.280004 Transcript_97894/m.280004 type:complete len:251 (-) Transcript_97894:238-990(-)